MIESLKQWWYKLFWNGLIIIYKFHKFTGVEGEPPGTQGTSTEGRRRKHQPAKRLATCMKSKDWWWLFWRQQAADLYNIARIKSPLKLVPALPNCNCVSFLTWWSYERDTFVNSSSRLPFMHAHLNIPLLTFNSIILISSAWYFRLLSSLHRFCKCCSLSLVSCLCFHHCSCSYDVRLSWRIQTRREVERNAIVIQNLRATLSALDVALTKLNPPASPTTYM